MAKPGKCFVEVSREPNQKRRRMGTRAGNPAGRSVSQS
jgi:hypothetical protein